MLFININNGCFFQDDKQVIMLNSFEEFTTWYLSFFDYNIFSSSDIAALLQEEKPDSYPCIPIYMGVDYGLIFLDIKFIRYLAKNIG